MIIATIDSEEECYCTKQSGEAGEPAFVQGHKLSECEQRGATSGAGRQSSGCALKRTLYTQ